jgi:hypothetical protein
MAAFTLPSDWTVKAVTRKSGKTAGRVDKYYYSPSGKRYRSLKQVKLVLSETPQKWERVWVRDPKTRRLVRVSGPKSVQKIDVGTQVEEIFKTQAVPVPSRSRWLPSSALLFSALSLACCTLAVI